MMGWEAHNACSDSIWDWIADYFNGEICPIKWGHHDCSPNLGVWDEQLWYDCDQVGGMSGAGLWAGNIVYCVNAYEYLVGEDRIPTRNGCARITSDKFNTMYDHMLAVGGWSVGEVPPTPCGDDCDHTSRQRG